MKKNNKIKFIVISFSIISICLLAFGLIQSSKISDLKSVNKNLSDENMKLAVENKNQYPESVEEKYFGIESDSCIKFIRDVLLPKLDSEELFEICKNSSSYDMYICEIDAEFTERDGRKYIDSMDEIGERIYFDTIDNISDINIGYENFIFNVVRGTNETGYILVSAGIKDISVLKPWLEIVDYNNYEMMSSSGGFGGEVENYIFLDVKKDTSINIELNDDLAKLFNFDSNMIKINVK